MSTPQSNPFSIGSHLPDGSQGPSPGSWTFGGQQSAQQNLGWQARASVEQSNFEQLQAGNDRERQVKEAMRMLKPWDLDVRRSGRARARR